jgi:hypothetical protein
VLNELLDRMGPEYAGGSDERWANAQLAALKKQ